MTDTTTPAITVWPGLHYDDALAAARFLTDVLGFREALTVSDDDGDVVHAEYHWPEGGAVMMGSTKHCDKTSGSTGVYVVAAEAGTVDERYERVRAAEGFTVTEALHEADYGSHTFTASDPEGNLWTFGTYRGAPVNG